MDYKGYFAPYAVQINDCLEEFFKDKIEQTGKITPLASDFWRKLKSIMEGGKRVRGGLVKLGYECFKKEGLEKVLPASIAVEMVHSALLIHDDVIDQSSFRHHKPTVHKQYEFYHRQNYKKGSPDRYGENMAIVVGILGEYEAMWQLGKLDLPAELKIRAINELCRYVEETGYGEGLDVDLPNKNDFKQEEVLTIHSLKTAQYTFIGPLRMGGILAGAEEKEFKGFEEYGECVGMAYQIQDDILGMFGKEEKTGKPIDDDVKEGKNTLLYTYAMEKGDLQQKKRLKSLWGKKDITKAEFLEARKIIESTGSLAYSQKMMQKLVSKGKKAVSSLTKDKELQEVFVTLADFITNRES